MTKFKDRPMGVVQLFREADWNVVSQRIRHMTNLEALKLSSLMFRTVFATSKEKSDAAFEETQALLDRIDARFTGGTAS